MPLPHVRITIRRLIAIVLVLATSALVIQRTTLLLKSSHHVRASNFHFWEGARIKGDEIDPLFFTTGPLDEAALKAKIVLKVRQLHEAVRRHRLAKEYLRAALFPFPVKEDRLFPWIPDEPDATDPE
jgi:hypothetical protein